MKKYQLILCVATILISACKDNTLPTNAGSVVETPPTAPKEEPSEKRVCIKTYDAKEKKNVEKCRVVKIHKKYEGTVIPKN